MPEGGRWREGHIETQRHRGTEAQRRRGEREGAGQRVFIRVCDMFMCLREQASSWYGWDEYSEADGAADATGEKENGVRQIQVGIDGEWNANTGGQPGYTGGYGSVGAGRGGGKTQVIEGRVYTDDQVRQIAEEEGPFFRPGVGVRLPRGVISQYTGMLGSDGYGLEQGYDPPLDADFDDSKFMGYGATRAERREMWWAELCRKQLRDLTMNYMAPPEHLRTDRSTPPLSPSAATYLHVCLCGDARAVAAKML